MNAVQGSPPTVALRVVFWRAAAYLTGLAIRRKTDLDAVLGFAPAVLYGALAYALGWLIGQLLRG